MYVCSDGSIHEIGDWRLETKDLTGSVGGLVLVVSMELRWKKMCYMTAEIRRRCFFATETGN